MNNPTLVLEPFRILFEDCGHPHYTEHHCDDEFSVYQLPKDRLFGMMRRDVYFSQEPWLTNAENIGFYTNDKNRLKVKNGELYTLFQNNKKLILSDLIQSLDIVEFNIVPSVLRIPVINGRLLEFDGNQKSALFESINSFYVVKWLGS